MQTRTQNKRSVMRQTVLIAAASAAISSSLQSASAVGVDQIQIYFPSSTAFQGNNMGGFDYNPTANSYWTAGFGGTQTIRNITFDGANWSGANTATQTDWVAKFLASTSLTDNGGNGTILDSNYSSASTIGDIQLNTSTLTIDGRTYAPRSVAIIIDNAVVRDERLPTAQKPQPQYSKIAYAYDLRTIGTAAAPGSRDRNSNGIVDWNDAFFPILTTADLQTVQGAPVGPTLPNVARRFALSSNSQFAYFNDAGANYGGIWRVNLTSTGTASLTKVVNSLTGTRINSEPVVIPSSLRAFGPANGDQILFAGSTDTGNLGGINFVTDNGSTVTAPAKVLSAKQLLGFYEISNLSFAADSITADTDGNVYFYNGNNPTGVAVYSKDGYLAKITSSAEERVFVNSQTGTTTFSASHLDFKTRQVVDGGNTFTQVLWNDNTLRTVVAATAYKVGDFDRNDQITIADINAFKANLGLRGVAAATLNSSTLGFNISAADKDKLKYDLNGTNSVTAAGLTTVTAIIDWKDVKVLQQFTGLSDGDVDMDFDVDSADLTTVANNYNTDSKLFTQGNLTSVRIANADKDAVNYPDLVTLAANWTAANPDLSGFSAQVQADGDRAFGITAGSTRTQYKALGSGNWSDANNWTNGVPNSSGAIANLLTKPQDDVALNVDGGFALHQLNFDNFFTYTLGGSGSLAFNASNGRNAEINTFAASPTISASVQLNGDTNVTVTYATDTLTMSNMQPGTGGLTKAGPGVLAVNNFRGGALAVNGGTLSVLPNGTSSGASRVTTLTIAGGARMDLTDNDLVVTNSSYSAVTSLIASARNGGSWNGSGLTSSTAAAASPKNKTLGALTGTQYLSLGQTTFDGFNVAASDVLVKFTYYGDTDLNGIVNFDDYARTDAGFNSGGTTWFQGDNDYNGLVNFDDYALIDLGFNTQSGTLIRAMDFLEGEDRSMRGMSDPALQKVVEHFAQFGSGYATSFLQAVPEPTSALLFAGVVAAAIMRRRRR